MLPTLLLSLAVAHAPKDVSLDDLKQFEIAVSEVRNRLTIARQFREFIIDSKPDTGTNESMKSGSVYGHLTEALDTQQSLEIRLLALRDLRRELGEKDYYAGKLPLPCPPKYQRALEQWVKALEVSLDDLKRFEITAAEVQFRLTIIRQFREFSEEKKLRTKEFNKIIWVYGALSGSLDTQDNLQSRLASLRTLRKELGQKDYKAGMIPPPYPAKYHREFELWKKTREINRKLKIADDGKERT